MRILMVSLLLVSTAFSQDRTVPQQGPPPKDLARLADGHFSANDDPANPDRYEVHVVQQGETLSMISGHVMKNPLLWPQLWEQNEHIINPHWIYPNDKVLIRPVTKITEAVPPPVVQPPAPAPTPAAPLAAPARPTPRQQPAQPVAPPPAPVQDVFILTPPRFVPEIKVSDLYCSGFVQVAAAPTDLKVIAKHDATGSALAREADYIYLSQGSDNGLRAGDMFNVIRPTKRIESRTRRSADSNLGTHYLEVAQLQVVMLQPDFALARVIHSCEAVELGDIMIPFQRVDLPALPRPRQFNAFNTGSSGVLGSVVFSRDALVNFGTAFHVSSAISGVQSGDLASLEMGVASEGGIVYVDLGQADGVRPGDILTVSRPIELETQLYDLPREADRLKAHRTAIGEIVVLKVKERASTALVTYSTDAISAGDSVERR